MALGLGLLWLLIFCSRCFLAKPNGCRGGFKAFEDIPAETLAIGFAGTEDDPETGLWRPFGSRRVFDLTRDNVDQLLGHDVQVVVASAYGIRENYDCSLEQWLSEKHLRVLGREQLVVKIAQGKQEWVVAMRP